MELTQNQRSANKKPTEVGFCFCTELIQAASALILADRRLLCRAALFLWKMPLSATESITAWAVLNRSAAFSLSPVTTAFCTFLMTVRNLERSAVLAALSFTS